MEPVDGGEGFLNFVALDGSAHLIGGAPEDFALGMAHMPDAREAAVGVGAVDEAGDQDLTPLLCEATGELLGGRQTRLETGDLFGGDVAVGEGDDGRLGRAVGNEEKAFGLEIAEHGPRHMEGLEARAVAGFGGGSQRGVGERVEPQMDGGTGVDDPEDLGEAGAVGGDGLLVGVGGGEIAVPMTGALGGGVGEHPVEITINAADELGSEIAFEGERGGPG